MNRFDAKNSYCVEAEATIQALEIANNLDIAVAEFEGDALNVIMALIGLAQYEGNGEATNGEENNVPTHSLDNQTLL